MPNDVDNLVGTTPVVLRETLGAPTLIRHDGPAEVWLYRSSSCAIDLILYADATTDQTRVAAVDARPSHARLSDGGCLASMETAGKTAGRLARGTF